MLRLPLALLLLSCALLVPLSKQDAQAQETTRGTETGLPLPRWAALDGLPTRARVGPGRRYAVEWEYHRKGLPVQIIDEFEHWRRVVDWQGSEGWVHSSLLKGQARFQVVGTATGLAANPSALAESAHFAELGEGVIGDLLACTQDKAVCEVRLEDSIHGTVRGWVQAENLYGGFPPE